MSTSSIEVMGSDLTKSDLEQLAQSGISARTAGSAMLRRVDSEAGANIVGRKDNGKYAGIIIPYIWPGQEYAREYRLRLDYPEFEQKSDGNIKLTCKYLSPHGSRNMLYLAPGTLPEWLLDTDLPIILTEGEKKCLALNELAWRADAAEQPAWLSIATSGVWNWRGTVGKTEGPNGERTDIKGAIPDLDKLAWSNRQVTILFDANVQSKEDIKIARNSLARELRERGARISFLDIPLNCRVNGVDDLIGVWGHDRVLDLIRTRTYDPKKKGDGRKEYPAPNGDRQWSEKPSLPPQPQFDPVFTDAILAMEIPENKMLVAELLPARGCSMLVGKSKAGKSVLAFQLAIAVASGYPLLDWYEILEPGPVLIIEQDDSSGTASWKETLEKSPVKLSVARIGFEPRKKGRFLCDEFIAQLEAQIDAIHPKLVILDSYTALRPRRSGADVVKDESDDFTALDELGTRKNCLILVIHHASKGAIIQDWDAQSAGTYAVGAAIQSQIHIARFAGTPMKSKERLVRVIGRHLDGVEFVMRFRASTLDYEFILEGSAASVYPQLVRLRNIYRAGQSFTWKDLMASGYGRSRTFEMLQVLLDCDVLTKPSYGSYALTPW